MVEDIQRRMQNLFRNGCFILVQWYLCIFLLCVPFKHENPKSRSCVQLIRLEFARRTRGRNVLARFGPLQVYSSFISRTQSPLYLFLSRIHHSFVCFLCRITVLGADVNLKWKLNSKHGSQEDLGH